MFLNYIRKKLYANLTLARQSWETKNNNFYNYRFKHLNLEYRNYGNSNPTKYFYIIRRAPGAGFFSNLNFVIHHLLICDNLKMIPVIDMENFQTFYNCKDKILGTFNSWNYYFISFNGSKTYTDNWFFDQYNLWDLFLFYTQIYFSNWKKKAGKQSDTFCNG